ncbi:uncharacterized protein EI97DRAFT_96799 [Westerdykella ornata]|uniref:Uncharacterized protein n=1 Tax=Westerdykella ornata TaxID=318751 RepID=A0A6A6JEJ5_WESOR|nr:uncharacterized protein EI97DRAFT_96799 [Westerdykella ornata]KAF2274685.1 hypothetical protein EI97DRAFT_96799 [Westerdykella ornata]
MECCVAQAVGRRGGGRERDGGAAFHHLTRFPIDRWRSANLSVYRDRVGVLYHSSNEPSS